MAFVIARSFGKNVCRLRNARGMTQEVLSDRATISRTHLQSIEWGKTNPSIEVANRIRSVLKCSWDDLLGKS